MRGDPVAESLDVIKSNNGAIHRLWNFPRQNGWANDGNSPTGAHAAELQMSEMGGAITFAWDPQMCQVLNPLFGVDLWGLEFSSCSDIAAAVRSAFDSWSMNHPRIKFMDVSNECLALSAAGAENFTDLSEVNPCPLARIWLTTTSAEAKEDAAAVTTSWYSHTAFRHTNGRWAANAAHVVSRSTIGFKRDDICWYLDATYCDTINKWKQSMGPSNLLILGRGLIFALWGIVLADVCWLFADFCRKQAKVRAKEAREHKSPNITALEAKVANAKTPVEAEKARLVLNQAYIKAEKAQKKTMEGILNQVDEFEEWAAMMEQLARVDWVPWIFRILLLMTPVLFYTMIFEPCFSCYDFQAAVTHEIGHVLGLAHPDQAMLSGQNIMISRTAGERYALALTSALVSTAYDQGEMGAQAAAAAAARAELRISVEQVEMELIACGGVENCLNNAKIDCWNPWTRAMVRPNASLATEPYAPSIMAAFTFNNPSKCIFQDDLDALNVLYPTCEAAQTYPVCSEPKTYLGVVRLFAYVFLPAFFTLVTMALCNRLTVYMHRRQRMRGIQKLQQVSADPEAHMFRPDGSKMSKLEQKVVLMEAHAKALVEARRSLLKSGKSLKSTEVVALDEKIDKLHAKLKRFREFGDAADDIDDDDDTWFDDVLMPIKKIASAMVRLARKYERQTRVARITPNNDAGTQSAYAVEEEPPAGMESR